MSSISPARVQIVLRILLRQNRLIIALLLVWPFVLSLLLLAVEHAAPSPEDTAAVLEQELFYGLVLVGLGASVALGTEQRGRRTHQVLGRAVSRTEYLLALGLSAYVPFAGYTLVWLVNAAGFAGLLQLKAPALVPVAAAEMAAGLLMCAAGLLSSVLLPQMLAATATGVLLAALLAAGAHGWGGPAVLFGVVVGFTAPMRASLLGSAGWAVLASLVLLGAAGALFGRRDVRLS